MEASSAAVTDLFADGTPAELGYRMPAEWEPHEATWLSWPSPDGESYPHILEEVRPSFLALIEALAPREQVFVNIGREEERQFILENTSAEALKALTIFDIPTREPWCRDIAPSFVINPKSAKHPRVAVCFDYNAWGGKYPPFERDQAAGFLMAEAVTAPVFRPGIFLEGGALEVNGHGTLVTSRSCALNPNRNPKLSEARATEILCGALGLDHVIWLTGVDMEGDDTDGHVDVTTRFASEDRMVVAVEKDKSSMNYDRLQANLKEVNAARLADGRKLDVVALPNPAKRVWDEEWQTWLPRGYANFHVANGAVLVPVYDEPEDEAALAILADAFPGRKMIPIDSRVLITGQGGVHCLTQQVPAVG